VNWAYAFRQICESYWGVTPMDLQHGTLDQIFLMTCDKEELKRMGSRRRITGTPAELAAGGLVKLHPSGMSTVQLVRARKRSSADVDAKRRRREERIARMRAEGHGN
jgi:hypothetical protein